MQIRLAVESDLPAIIEIYNAAIPTRLATADLDSITVESRRAWFRSHDLATFCQALYLDREERHKYSLPQFCGRRGDRRTFGSSANR